MSAHHGHQDLAMIEDAEIREHIAQVFRDSANGTPDDISKAGCLVLARKGKDVWNAWRVLFPARPTNVMGQYENIADFSGQVFLDPFNFDHFEFLESANFSNTNFTGRVSFQDASFGDYTNFSAANFNLVFFHRATFRGITFFNKTIFDTLNLHQAHFHGAVLFNGCSFGRTSIEGVRFSGIVEFNDCEFQNTTRFSSEKLGGCFFDQVPEFHRTKLYPTISFEMVALPKASGDKRAATAYQALKLAYSQLQNIREEQRFFKLEMEEETLRETGVKRLLFKGYKRFSDFGFSVTRPLLLALGALFVFAMLYGAMSWLTMCQIVNGTCQFTPAWLEFSVLQALPVPGLDKWSDGLRAEFLPVQGLGSFVVTTFVILHKAVSLLALFLVGLALRNLFKLK